MVVEDGRHTFQHHLEDFLKRDVAVYTYFRILMRNLLIKNIGIDYSRNQHADYVGNCGTHIK